MQILAFLTLEDQETTIQDKSFLSNSTLKLLNSSCSDQHMVKTIPGVCDRVQNSDLHCCILTVSMQRYSTNEQVDGLASKEHSTRTFRFGWNSSWRLQVDSVWLLWNDEELK